MQVVALAAETSLKKQEELSERTMALVSTFLHVLRILLLVITCFSILHDSSSRAEKLSELQSGDSIGNKRFFTRYERFPGGTDRGMNEDLIRARQRGPRLLDFASRTFSKYWCFSWSAFGSDVLHAEVQSMTSAANGENAAGQSTLVQIDEKTRQMHNQTAQVPPTQSSSLFRILLGVPPAPRIPSLPPFCPSKK